MEGNKYYDNGVSTAVFIEKVLQQLDPNPCDAAYIWNIIKYARRAGLKPDTDWTDDAYKCANYLKRLIYGHWIEDNVKYTIKQDPYSD